MDGLGVKKRGPKQAADQGLTEEIVSLRRENKRLRARLKQAETIIDVQKKLSQMLGVELSVQESIESE